MQKRFLLPLFALLVLALLVWYALQNPLSPRTPPSDDHTGTTTPATYTEDEPYYTIEAHWPTDVPLPGDGNPAAVLLIKNWVQDTIVEFKQNGNYTNLTEEDLEMMGFADGRTHALDIMYLTSSSPRTISYVFSVYTDTGGAHPNGYFKTFVFDTQTGAHLSLADVFEPGSPHLAELSRISRLRLPATIGEFADTAYIDSGTTPETQNFETFFFDNSNFVLLFSPYQVGPWALGPVTLPIPAAELQNLRPTYP